MIDAQAIQDRRTAEQRKRNSGLQTDYNFTTWLYLLGGRVEDQDVKIQATKRLRPKSRRHVPPYPSYGRACDEKTKIQPNHHAVLNLTLIFSFINRIF